MRIDCERLIAEARRATGERKLLLHESLALLDCYGLPVARFELVTSPEEAVKAAEALGGRVALKIVSPDVIHKSDVGGVVLNVAAADVASAYRELVERIRRRVPSARIIGVLVQEMVPKGLEVIVGGLRDPVFGPLVALGLGGIFVEVYGDVAFRPTPLTDIDVDDMIVELRASRLILQGYRGMPPRDVNALKDVVLKIARLVEELPIKELDVNPLMLYGKGEGAKIVDARIVLSAR